MIYRLLLSVFITLLVVFEASALPAVIHIEKSGIQIGKSTYTIHYYSVDKQSNATELEKKEDEQVTIYPDDTLLFAQINKSPYGWGMGVNADIDGSQYCSLYSSVEDEGLAYIHLLKKSGIENSNFFLFRINQNWGRDPSEALDELRERGFETKEGDWDWKTDFDGSSALLQTVFPNCQPVSWEEFSSKIENRKPPSATEPSSPEQMPTEPTLEDDEKSITEPTDQLNALEKENEELKHERDAAEQAAERHRASSEQTRVRLTEVKEKINSLEKELKEAREAKPVFPLEKWLLPAFFLLFVALIGLYVFQLWSLKRQRKLIEQSGRAKQNIIDTIHLTRPKQTRELQTSTSPPFLREWLDLFEQSRATARDLIDKSAHYQRLFDVVARSRDQAPTADGRPDRDDESVPSMRDGQSPPAQEKLLNALLSQPQERYDQMPSDQAMIRQIRDSLNTVPVLSGLALDLGDCLAQTESKLRQNDEHAQRRIQAFEKEKSDLQEEMNRLEAEKTRQQKRGNNYKRHLLEDLKAVGYFDTDIAHGTKDLHTLLRARRVAMSDARQRSELQGYVRDLIALRDYLRNPGIQGLPYFKACGLQLVLEGLEEKKSFESLYQSDTPQKALEGQWNGFLQYLYRSVLLLDTYWRDEAKPILPRLNQTKATAEIVLREYGIRPHRLELPVDQEWVEQRSARVKETQEQGVEKALEESEPFRNRIKPEADQRTIFCDIATWGYDLSDQNTLGQPSQLVAKRPHATWP
ncbi:hypothetical protein [Candidatus Thiosymbion oneisti]|uniref:hypothetical protein n=1 Tax=Candidatus Thiosymbion oneisti TaxID=589554 RepID=UPI000B800FC3|nr:hypothetical protein [Candidatus Thiosymbion oneisti]